MKTKLTIRVLRDGEKDLTDTNHCIGATLLRKALKEQGRDTVTGFEKWVSWSAISGYTRGKANEFEQYYSFVNGKEANLMSFGNYTTWQRVKLFFFPVTVEFRKI
jgi:hypothetical protein